MLEAGVIDDWAGDFGDDYTRRQEDTIDQRAKFFDHTIGMGDLNIPWGPDGLVRKVLEVGSSVGYNLDALSQIGFPKDDLYGLEPNDSATHEMLEKGYLSVSGSAIDILAKDGEFDVVFTCGLLIHIPPDDVQKAVKEIVRVSNHYVLVMEYYSATPEMVEYQGQKDMLWKHDFGQMFLDVGLKHIDHGFAWKPVTGLDNLTWWLFEK